MEKKCIKISNIKISPDKDTTFLEGVIRKELRLGKDAQIDYEIAKGHLTADISHRLCIYTVSKCIRWCVQAGRKSLKTYLRNQAVKMLLCLKGCL